MKETTPSRQTLSTKSAVSPWPTCRQNPTGSEPKHHRLFGLIPFSAPQIMDLRRAVEERIHLDDRLPRRIVDRRRQEPERIRDSNLPTGRVIGKSAVSPWSHRVGCVMLYCKLFSVGTKTGEMGLLPEPRTVPNSAVSPRSISFKFTLNSCLPA